MNRLFDPSRLLVATTLLLVAFSGCTSEEPTKALAAPPSATAQIVESNSTAPVDAGDIQGTVKTEEQAPIGGVTVFLREAEVSVTTDVNGSFAFTQVPVGKYAVIASKLGFEERGLSVEVVSGEATTLDIVMVQVEIVESYFLTTVSKGKISCGAVLVPFCGVTDELSQDYGTPNPTEEHWLFRWTFDQGKVPSDVIFELVWQPTVPETAKAMTLLGTDGFSDSATGPSGLKLAVSGGNFDEIEEDPAFRFGIGVYPDIEPVVDQTFELYRTDFYGDRAPEAFSALPTG